MGGGKWWGWRREETDACAFLDLPQAGTDTTPLPFKRSPPEECCQSQPTFSLSASQWHGGVTLSGGVVITIIKGVPVKVWGEQSSGYAGVFRRHPGEYLVRSARSAPAA